MDDEKKMYFEGYLDNIKTTAFEYLIYNYNDRLLMKKISPTFQVNQDFIEYALEEENLDLDYKLATFIIKNIHLTDEFLKNKFLDYISLYYPYYQKDLFKSLVFSHKFSSQSLREIFNGEWDSLDQLDCFTFLSDLIKYQTLTEDFIKDFMNHLLNMDSIFKHQSVSEEFILEYKNRVNPDIVSRYQKFSENFFWENTDYFVNSIETILNNQNLSWAQKGNMSDEFRLYLEINNIEIPGEI